MNKFSLLKLWLHNKIYQPFKNINIFRKVSYFEMNLWFTTRVWRPLSETYLIKNAALIFAICLVLSGISVGYFFMSGLMKDFQVTGDISIDVTKTGAVGDFVAGVIGTIFSLAAFIMVYLSYKDQKRANEKNEIESRIFTMINIHVENSTQINYQPPVQNGN
ncbi:hypothetical protein [Pedobacter sp. BMA]|uniref:hypothetical protein n=1 Tax=Pedobacter sp. BMA TaxID=1663685 RepID=UPI0006493320|nr:hypothetical protein [Pedobacter sp. BMA]KLT64739.1 hypothetical protein AB669_13415 [Pedobacter sp. BMA]